MVFPQVKKDSVDVIIRTSNERIEGSIFKVPETRVLEMLNRSTDNFLAVSNARIYNIETGKLLFGSDFLVVNKNHIVYMVETSVFPES